MKRIIAILIVVVNMFTISILLCGCAPCDTCKGEGYIYCSDCNEPKLCERCDEGKVECRNCDGDAWLYIDCYRCDGKGYVTNPKTLQTYSCEKVRKVDCLKCEYGKVDCYECDYGKVYEECTTCGSDHALACPDCANE